MSNSQDTKGTGESILTYTVVQYSLCLYLFLSLSLSLSLSYTHTHTYTHIYTYILSLKDNNRRIKEEDMTHTLPLPSPKCSRDSKEICSYHLVLSTGERSVGSSLFVILVPPGEGER